MTPDTNLLGIHGLELHFNVVPPRLVQRHRFAGICLPQTVMSEPYSGHTHVRGTRQMEPRATRTGKRQPSPCKTLQRWRLGTRRGFHPMQAARRCLAAPAGHTAGHVVGGEHAIRLASEVATTTQQRSYLQMLLKRRHLGELLDEVVVARGRVQKHHRPHHARRLHTHTTATMGHHNHTVKMTSRAMSI